VKLLDLFCGAGGAGMGYHRAGFEVIGVDINPQPRYPFEFHQGDALQYCADHGYKFDVIHASPPCQVYSTLAALGTNADYPDLVGAMREILVATGKPYIIENVQGAPLINPIKLCGTMFGLKTIRHRLFETSPAIWWPPSPCMHVGKCAPIFWGDLIRRGYKPGTSKFGLFDYIVVAGNSWLKNDGQIAMEIDWMIKPEMSQAIPPAYTKWLGGQIRALLCN